MRSLLFRLLGLAFLAGCTRTEPVPLTVASSGPSRVSVGAVDGGVVSAPPRSLPAKPGMSANVVGVTRDGKRAFVRFDDQHGHVAPAPFRWITIATNSIESERTFEALHGLPLETMNEGATPTVRSNPALTAPALEADLRDYAAALGSLDEPRDERFDVSGGTIVFNVGDWLQVADAATGKVGARLSSDASYYPHVAKSGAFVVYTREQGLLDGVVGNYMPFVAPLPAGGPSRRLEVKDVDGELSRLSLDGQYLYVQTGHEKPENGCLVRVAIAPPSAVTKLFCVPSGERIDGVRFSPSRTFAVVHSRAGRVGPERATWVHLPDGAKIGEVQMSSAFQVATVDDLGVGVASGVTIGSAETALLEPASHRHDELTTGIAVPFAFYGAAWVSGSSFVVGEGGGVRLVDLTRAPKRSVPWPSGAFLAPSATGVAPLPG